MWLCRLRLPCCLARNAHRVHHGYTPGYWGLTRTRTRAAGTGLVMGTKFSTRTRTCGGYTRGVRAGREGQGEGYTSNSTTRTMVCVVPLLLCPLRAGMGCTRASSSLRMEEGDGDGV